MEKKANRVFVDYLGLPEQLYKQIFAVGRDWRTNERSHIEGGSDVIVEFNDGKVCLYDWIDYPDRYIRSFFSGSVHYPKSEQIKIAKDKVSRIFCRIHEDIKKQKDIPFEEVWNSRNTNTIPGLEITPWKALKNFILHKKREKLFGEDYIWVEDCLLYPDAPIDDYYLDDIDYAIAVCGIPDPRLVEND
ncbi:hypothetical protein [Planktothrix sp. FACHB-1365]|uniref:hypothetical protein n=1 Tax=Planktothrix sp. FACHB-1365 TaxID=2692855 RepID=UPI0016824D43|nr:hypothetical protein [Planktothrix sp. FACHB-1365]MBD2480567.1 hypothetical protein [Planktothrix sp. FACHB-1365]